MKNPIALIFNGVWSQQAFAQMEPYHHHYDLVYIHSLTADQLNAYEAAVVPFQSSQSGLLAKRALFFDWLAQGKKLAVFGDNPTGFLPAIWEERPVNNYWWKTDPHQPPIAWTDRDHPIYQKLQTRHACWHHHGVYTQIPEAARIIQHNQNQEVITWETKEFGGCLLASTKDPIVEHGINQIRHLHHYCNQLTQWLLTPVKHSAVA